MCKLQNGHKLKAIKESIELWVKEEKVKEKNDICSILDEISGLDEKDGLGGLNSDECEKMASLKIKLASIINAEESSWRQKSREKWLKDGD